MVDEMGWHCKRLKGISIRIMGLGVNFLKIAPYLMMICLHSQLLWLGSIAILQGVLNCLLHC